MAKKHKIKNYSDKTNFFGKQRKTSLIKPIISLFILGLLVFVGVSAYKPVKDFFQGNTKPSSLPENPDVVDTALTPDIPETTPLALEDDVVVDIVVIDNVKAIIMPTDVSLDSEKIDNFLNSIPENINTVVITAKNNQGEIFYSSSIPQATQWAAIVQNPIDLKQLKTKLEEKNLFLAVRFSVFSDPIAARADLDNNAIMHSSGVVWIDNTLANGGKPWVTPYSQPVRDYNISLIKELTDLGTDLIVLDYMRFPNDPTSSAQVNATEGVSREQILNTFYADATAALDAAPTRIAVSIDLWSAQQQDSGINGTLFGGNPMNLSIDQWVVSIDDYDIDSSEVTDFVSAQASKTLIWLTQESANYTKLSSSDYEFILY